MEGGTSNQKGVGPTSTTTTTTTTWNNNNNRPVRAASSRHFNYGPHHHHHHSATLTGPVRRWQKRWVPVSPPLKKPTSSSSAAAARNKAPPSNSRILLCKWTPLSVECGEVVPRKFRYTPIAVVKEQNKATPKRVADEDFAVRTHLSEETPATGIALKYGMLDINTDLAESPPQETSKGRPLSHYSRRN